MDVSTSAANPDLTDVQISFILGEIERLNELMRLLHQRGVLTNKDELLAQLNVDMKKAERKARILKLAGRDVSDAEAQLAEIRMKISALSV